MILKTLDISNLSTIKLICDLKNNTPSWTANTVTIYTDFFIPPQQTVEKMKMTNSECKVFYYPLVKKKKKEKKRLNVKKQKADRGFYPWHLPFS